MQAMKAVWQQCSRAQQFCQTHPRHCAPQLSLPSALPTQQRCSHQPRPSQTTVIHTSEQLQKPTLHHNSSEETQSSTQQHFSGSGCRLWVTSRPPRAPSGPHTWQQRWLWVPWATPARHSAGKPSPHKRRHPQGPALSRTGRDTGSSARHRGARPDGASAPCCPQAGAGTPSNTPTR